MDSIRVGSNAKKIEVNDDGEYIILNFDDAEFPIRFYSLLKNIQQKGNKLQEQLSNQELTAEERLMLEHEVNVFFRDEIDKLFGTETCRKVYGNILPSAQMHIELLDKLAPFFEDYAKKRQAKMNRYSAKRSGNV